MFKVQLLEDCILDQDSDISRLRQDIREIEERNNNQAYYIDYLQELLQVQGVKFMNFSEWLKEQG